MKRSLLFYLGWVATEASRDFLISILDGRIEGPRRSAIRTLSWSSIPDRYEIIVQYLEDPDERVRKEVAEALKERQEMQKEEVEQAPADDFLKTSPDE